MQLFSMQLLFLATALLAVSFATAQTTTYQPASGYYKCPAIGMVCNVKNCNVPGECSILPNGFDVMLVNETAVYTSTMEDAELSIVGTDDSTIACDVSCDCQIITADGRGCAIPADGDFEDGIVTSTGSEYQNIDVSEANTEASAAAIESTRARVSVAGSVLSVMAVVMATLAL